MILTVFYGIAYNPVGNPPVNDGDAVFSDFFNCIVSDSGYRSLSGYTDSILLAACNSIILDSVGFIFLDAHSSAGNGDAMLSDIGKLVILDAVDFTFSKGNAILPCLADSVFRQGGQGAVTNGNSVFCDVGNVVFGNAFYRAPIYHNAILGRTGDGIS